MLKTQATVTGITTDGYRLKVLGSVLWSEVKLTKEDRLSDISGRFEIEIADTQANRDMLRIGTQLMLAIEPESRQE